MERSKGVCGSCRGMVHVEFLVAALPFLTLVMGLAQIMLMDAAKLAVINAASAAARAAAVVLDDDPKQYGGEPRNSAPPGSKRYQDIARAAQGALVAVDAPSRAANDEQTFMNAVLAPHADANVTRLFTPGPWLRERVRVRFPGNREGSFGPQSDVVVRVEFDFPCIVPFVRGLLCNNHKTRTLTAEASLPNQAAPYDYEGGAGPAAMLSAATGEGG